VRTARRWLAAHELPRRVVFCCFGGTVARAYRVALDMR